MNARLLLALTLLPLAVHAADWPQYRGPEGNGITTEKITKPWSAASKPVWKAPIVGGFASFAVAGNKAFTLALRDLEGANQEALVTLDAATGKELWAAPLNYVKYGSPGKDGDSGAPGNDGGDGPRSTPTVMGNSVFVLSSMLTLRGFDVTNGKVLWTRDLMKEHNGRNIHWFNAASPLLEGGLLYVAGGGQGESLLAVNPKDGAVVWKAFDETITHATPVAATILGQRQVIFFVQSGLLAVDPKSGKELWRYPFKFSVSTAASPVVSGDIVYCSAGYGVGAGAVKITKAGAKFTATEIYRLQGNKPVANHWSTPIVKDGFLYGMFQFKEYGKGPVKCVDIAKGEVKWEKEGFGPGQVILAGDKVVALADNGDLVLIDPNPAAYKELARMHLVNGKCWSTPVLANGRLYVRSTKEAAALDVK
jgi:outer membrane protein assembly factor BamB